MTVLSLRFLGVWYITTITSHRKKLDLQARPGIFLGLPFHTKKISYLPMTCIQIPFPFPLISSFVMTNFHLFHLLSLTILLAISFSHLFI